MGLTADTGEPLQILLLCVNVNWIQSMDFLKLRIFKEITDLFMIENMLFITIARIHYQCKYICDKNIYEKMFMPQAVLKKTAIDIKPLLPFKQMNFLILYLWEGYFICHIGVE